jgi:hypothetical protein
MQRNVLLQIRLSAAEHAALKVAAADCGMSEFVRQAIAPWLTSRTPEAMAQYYRETDRPICQEDYEYMTQTGMHATDPRTPDQIAQDEHAAQVLDTPEVTA